MVSGLEYQFDAQLSSIIQSFDNHPISRSVKQFTIAVEAWKYYSWADVVMKFSSCSALELLDHVLSTSPATFERCSIIVDYDPNDPHDNLLDTIQSQLPRLQERGVLLVRSGTSEELRKAAWATVNH
jgi:hypothetical protein